MCYLGVLASYTATSDLLGHAQHHTASTCNQILDSPFRFGPPESRPDQVRAVTIYDAVRCVSAGELSVCVDQGHRGKVFVV